MANKCHKSFASLLFYLERPFLEVDSEIYKHATINDGCKDFQARIKLLKSQGPKSNFFCCLLILVKVSITTLKENKALIANDAATNENKMTPF